MIHSLQSAFAFILVLGVVVFVHEGGHFLAAKRFRIGVPVFSLGFGPRLFGFRRNETDYRVSAIPLGGYVRMAGDEADEHRTGAPDEFLSRPRWQRLIVYLGGAVFNICLALLLTWFVFWVFGKDEAPVPKTHPVVARILAGSTAEAAGIRTGDRVLSIGGADARQPSTYRDEVILSPGKRKPVVLEREGERVTVQLDTGRDPKYQLGSPGWYLLEDSAEPPIIEEITEGSPAQKAGLRAGDRVLAADDRDPVTELELRAMLEASPGREIVLEVERDGGILEIGVTPRSDGGTGRIGVGFLRTVHRSFGALEAAKESVRVNLELSKTVYLTLRKVVTGQISLRAFSGPVGIAEASGQAVRRIDWLLSWIAFISLQLGILNLLPIPVLDGGHILLLAVEGLMRRELSDKVKERVMQAGFLFLITIFGIIMFFDIKKILP